jgi:hypothetical protein
MRAANFRMFTPVCLLAVFLLSSCTTANIGEGVKPDATPKPQAASESSEIAPLNETDTVTALLQPAAKLAPDTVEAALHDTKASKISYIGVWAADDAGCAKIDQTPYDGFAVITGKSIRQFEETCAINAAPPASNPVSVQAKCTSEGDSSSRQISLLTTAIGGLQIINKPGAKPVEYVRCELPK